MRHDTDTARPTDTAPPADTDTALDEVLATAESGVLETVTEHLDTERGWSLVYWAVVPTREAPLDFRPEPYPAQRCVRVPGRLPVPPTVDGRPRTLLDLADEAHRATEALAEALGSASGEAYLLQAQLDARIGCLHHRLRDSDLNGSQAMCLTLAVGASARRIRHRLVHGRERTLPLAPTVRSIGLATSVITAMEAVRARLQDLFADLDAVDDAAVAVW
ncbi:hypothetical protein [Streptomyces sp. NPDC057702]|uniref:hypothetical protein n=1 Tax=unclassified Streptomyces TaxID=2593676 RepID=UPI0036C4F11E